MYFRCKPSYKVTFIKKNGERVQASGKEGDSLLDVVVNNNLDFDGYGNQKLLKNVPIYFTRILTSMIFQVLVKAH